MAKKDEGVAGAIGSSQDFAGKVSKICRYVKRELEKMDLKAATTTQLHLADEVMYNMMDEEIVMGLWSRLETLYMTKSLSNKLYFKKQLFGLHMKEGITVLKHLNFFNKVISKLLRATRKTRH